MAARYVNVDRETPMLLPPDLRDWVAEDDLARFVVDAVETCDLRPAKVNPRGSGDPEYPPGMMLGLLIYGYAHRIFSSRAIERATYSHVSVRYLCANLHPDHDTVATFRRRNGLLLEHCFLRVLELARELKAFGQLGTVSVDGTKLQARASRNANRTAAELEAEIGRLQGEIRALPEAAEQADRSESGERDRLAPELRPRQARQEALRAAKKQLEERQAEHRRQRRRRDALATDPEEPSPPSCPPRGGAKAREPELGTLKGERQPLNLADPESRLMRDAHGHYLQADNAQLVVDAGASGLILGARATQDGNDRRALKTGWESVPASLRAEITHVVADTGYDHAELIAELESASGVCVLCPPQSRGTPKLGQTYRCTQARRQRQAQAEHLRQRLQEPENQVRYRRRSATVEPVIGVLKNVLGFQRFRLFGLVGSQIELTLLAISYNLRRMAQNIARQKA